MDEERLKDERKESPYYSETAYDDAFRTMEGKCDDLLIPFVSHMFGEKYGKAATVKRIRNEQFVEHEDGSIEKRVTDSSFEITDNAVTRKYHLECESKPYDGTILIRIFEYGSQIAKSQAEKDLYKVRVNFPNSGLLLLKTSKSAPDTAHIEIVVPDGTELAYDVPIMKLSNYTLDDIFDEKLFMLIPFYIFNYDDYLDDMNNSDEKVNELIKVYEDIFRRLDTELEKGNLSALSYHAIIKLTQSVAYKRTMGQENVHRKVGDFMGGKILDLPEFIIYDKAKAEGLEKGKMIARYEDGMSVQEIANKMNVSEDDVKSALIEAGMLKA